MLNIKRQIVIEIVQIVLRHKNGTVKARLRYWINTTRKRESASLPASDICLCHSIAILLVDVVNLDGKFTLHNILGLLGKRGFLINSEELIPFWSAGKVYQDKAKDME